MANNFLSPLGDLETYYLNEYDLIDKYVGDQAWTWGKNTDGQLGLGLASINEIRKYPTKIDSGSNTWMRLSVGNNFVGVIKTDGSLWTWGINTYGQLGLGNGSYADVNAPTQVGVSSDWYQISCGGYSTLALKTNGTLWTCGRNDYGQLGIGYTSSSGITTFTQIGTSSDWKQISSAGLVGAAIKTDGTLWTWGDNTSGKLGNNTVGILTTSPTQVSGTNSNWKQISAGNLMMAAVKRDGTLWVWGNNTGKLDGGVLSGVGQLGLGTQSPYVDKYIPTQLGSSTTWKYVNVGRQTAAIKTDGTLWTWGRNGAGQLGNGDLTGTDTNSPAQVSGGGNNWKTIVSGNNSMIAIKTDGTLWAWGSNNSYQIADGTTDDVYVPTQINTGSQTWKFADVRTDVSAAISIGINPE